MHTNENQKEFQQEKSEALQKKEKSTGKSYAAVNPFGGKSLGEENGGSITPPNIFGAYQLKANDTFPLSRPAVQLFKNNDTTSETPVQKKENNTGLPDNLKSGIENLSGFSMNDVKVHYNSDKPAQLQAHAYAQGTDIHLAAGQEKHLPHEAWHVVQQKQGRVKPTLQMKGKVNVNDDKGLEREADVMGAKAVQMKQIYLQNAVNRVINTKTLQRIENESNPISLEEAKKIILKATQGLGTNTGDIYDAIRRCNNRNGLKTDTAVLNALKGDMEGHELWKAYLLMEYGKEDNYPSTIEKLWTATDGFGTDEKAIFATLDSMDKNTKSSFGLKYILHWELSGDSLEKALDLVTTSDSIKGNLYGSGEKKDDLVISENKLRKLIDARFTGAATTKLKSAMEVLYQRPDGQVLKEALANVESARGLKAGTALGQYQKAIEKQNAGIAYYKKNITTKGKKYNNEKDNPSPALSKSNAGFTASSAQLRFGKVVGDAFGIDAVFGSLISPTGGMAGAGNDRISGVKDGGAVATHGAVHDAAGYLYNCHGIGTGYDYLQSEPGSQAGNPLAGQTNIQWWINEFDKTGNEVQYIDRILNSQTYIGAAFSKDYQKLNLNQKKEVLKVICGTSIAKLYLIDVDNTDRAISVENLIKVSGNDEKTELANYFYNNDGFNTTLEIYKIMQPHVSKTVYDAYVDRMSLKNGNVHQKW